MRSLIAGLLVLPLAAAAAERDKLIVLHVVPGDDSTVKTARLVEEQILTELTAQGRFDVAGESEIVAVLGMERQRQLLGCADESGSCLAEVTGALGARWVVMGTLGRFGGTLRLDLKLIDAKTGKAARREGRVLGSDGELFTAVTELLGRLVEVEPAPSKPGRPAGPFVAGAVGLAAAILGAVLMGLASTWGTQLDGRRSELTFADAQGKMRGFQAIYWSGFSALLLGLGTTAGATVFIIRGRSEPAAEVTVGSGGTIGVRW